LHAADQRTPGWPRHARNDAGIRNLPKEARFLLDSTRHRVSSVPKERDRDIRTTISPLFVVSEKLMSEGANVNDARIRSG